MDLGRDYYKLSGPELDSLSAKVRSGDMEEVLRVYEHEMQVSERTARHKLIVRARSRTPFSAAWYGPC